MRKTPVRDFLERLFWTLVVTSSSGMVASSLLDIEVWKVAAMNGLAAVIQAVVVFGRYRLSILPNPGEGLPGLPTTPVPTELRGEEREPKLPFPPHT